MTRRTVTLFRIVRIALSVLAVPLLTWVVLQNWTKFAVALQAPYSTFAAIAAVSVASLLANSLRLRVAASLFDTNLTFVESFNVSSANAFFNIVTPLKGGIAVKGMYLHDVHGMPWSGYGGSLLVTQSLATTLSTIAALVVLGMNDVVDPLVIAAIAGLVALAAGLTWRNRERFELLASENRHFNGVAGRLTSILRERAALTLYAVAHVLFLLCITTRLYLVFTVFLPEVEFWQVLLIQSALTATLFIGITPGNIGVQEGLVAVAGTFLAIDPATAVLASLSERAFLLLTVLPVGGLCSIFVMRRIRDAAGT